MLQKRFLYNFIQTSHQAILLRIDLMLWFYVISGGTTSEVKVYGCSSSPGPLAWPAGPWPVLQDDIIAKGLFKRRCMLLGLRDAPQISTRALPIPILSTDYWSSPRSGGQWLRVNCSLPFAFSFVILSSIS